VVINDLDAMRVPFAPLKANTPLIINTNAVLALTPALQGLQSVSRQSPKRAKIWRSVKHIQFAKRWPFDVLESRYGVPAKKSFRIGASEGADHQS
jgi:hypothetical protein